MAIPGITIQGKVLLPDGSPAAGGKLVARLSQPARALDGMEAEWVVAEQVFLLGPDGALPSGARLVPNSVLSPAGTTYEVEITVPLATGRPLTVRENWQLGSVPNVIAVGNITRVAQPALAIFVAGPPGAQELPTYDVASAPLPSAAVAFRLIAVTETGAPTLVQACLPNAEGAYEWVTFAQST